MSPDDDRFTVNMIIDYNSPVNSDKRTLKTIIMKILKGSADYFRYIENRSQDTIDYLMFNLPFDCNYNCWMKCCNHNRIVRVPDYPVLSSENIRNYILTCLPLGIRAVGIMSEGEPLLDKNFKKLADFVSGNGLIFYIFTNGSLFDGNLINFLATKDVSLIINIDSLRTEKYDKWVKRRGALNVVLNNLRAIREVYKNKIYESGRYLITSLAVNMVVNNENYEEIGAINGFCGGDIMFTINRPIFSGALLKHEKNYSQAFDFDDSLFRPLGTLKEVNQCYYLIKGITLSAQGFIIPCPYAVEATGLLGFSLENIMSDRQKVLEIVSNFHEKFGRARCLIRHPQYLKFINLIKKEEK